MIMYLNFSLAGRTVTMVTATFTFCLFQKYGEYHILFQYDKDFKKVQVGNDQQKAQSERNSHSKNRGGKNYIDN